MSDLVKRWPASTARREVLMISDGIDRYYGSGRSDDPYVEQAVDDARFAPAFRSPQFICRALDISGTATGNPIGDRFTFRRLRTRLAAKRITSDSPDRRFRLLRISRIWSAGWNINICCHFIPKPQKKSGWQQRAAAD